MEIFHSLIIPLLGGVALTLAKLIADHKVFTFNESNDIALDMVLVAVGALAAFRIKGAPVYETVDAGVGDVFIAAILLYIRYVRKRHDPVNPPRIGRLSGIAQFLLGLTAIYWTLNAI